MKKFALLAAAAVCFAPALISSASAQSVTLRVGDPGYHSYNQQRVVVSNSRHCRTTTVRTKRANGTIWVRQVRRCG